MSITAHAVEAPPPSRTIEGTHETASTQGAEAPLRRYERLEPIFGSFKLHRRGEESCFRHLNGGGLVALGARVEWSVFVGDEAAVLGHAIVRGQVRIEDQAIIEGNANVSGQTRMRHESRVSGNAVLEGHVTMQRHSQVSDNAHIRGMVSLDYYAFVGDESRLFGTMHLE